MEKLWGAVTLADLQKLDAVIKDKSLTPAEARAAAQKIKNAPPFTQSVIVVNPKIDSKTQRRIQCSLPFASFWMAVGRVPQPQESPELFGHSFPNPIQSSARRFSE